jgi:hypothetical protein
MVERIREVKDKITTEISLKIKAFYQMSTEPRFQPLRSKRSHPQLG